MFRKLITISIAVAILFAIMPVISSPTQAAGDRPYNIVSLQVVGGLDGGYKATFDNGETGTIYFQALSQCQPQIGAIDSFWYGWVDYVPPFFHAGGLTQGSCTFATNL